MQAERAKKAEEGKKGKSEYPMFWSYLDYVL